MIVITSYSIHYTKLYEFEIGEIDRKQSIDELNRFMREELNFVSGIMYLLCLHLFGGSAEFKNIFIPKKKLARNEKLHRIFNGAIDLVFPTIINKVTNSQYKTPIPHMIPVFVSTDKRISKLHSLMGLRITYNTKESYSFFPELVQADFLGNLKWTKEEMNHLYKLSTADIESVITSYSIHYTKLYDSLRLLRAVRRM